MITTLSVKDRRALAAGTVAIATIVGITGVAPRWQHWDRAQRDRVEIAAARLDVTRRQVAEAAREAVRLREKKPLTVAHDILREASASVAGARLAEIVSDAADEAGMKVGSVQIRPDSAAREKFTRVAVRIIGTTDIDGVATLLAAIEHNPLMLSVRELVVNTADPAAPDTRAEVLSVQILVEMLSYIDAAKVR